MEIIEGHEGQDQALVDLFAATFSDAEGDDEGALIGGLVQDLLTGTPPDEIRVFRAEEAGRVIGAAVFTRLSYPEDPRRVVLLSPMAVATDRQRQGVGQALLAAALAALRVNGVQVAITYGDPAYYRQVGFRPITEDDARAPHPLSQPHGWLGQSLTSPDVPRLVGPSTCVPALARPDIW